MAPSLPAYNPDSHAGHDDGRARQLGPRRRGPRRDAPAGCPVARWHSRRGGAGRGAALPHRKSFVQQMITLVEQMLHQLLAC